MKTVLLYFSPTHTTQQALHAVAEGIGQPYKDLDLTQPGARREFLSAPPTVGPDTLVLLGAPVYGGLIAAPFLQILGVLHGNGALCVPICLYGNRAFDEALLQLYMEACKAGFVPVAAAAFVGEHSFTSKVATGRPDNSDTSEARNFGAALHRQEATGFQRLKEADIPWKARDMTLLGRHKQNLSEITKRGPTVYADRCIGCGSCVNACPTAMLRMSQSGFAEVAGDNCIKCRACARSCSVGAIDIEHPLFFETVQDCIASFGSPAAQNIWVIAPRA